MTQTMPRDPVMLLSFINLKLRDYYSDLESNECELVELRWMSLKPVIQSEVGQKNKYHRKIHITICKTDSHWEFAV